MNKASGRYVIEYLHQTMYCDVQETRSISILATSERDAREHFDTHYRGKLVSCNFEAFA